MAQVSIIVPVYQVEKYLRQCIDSILAQTFRDFELILVDDGSKDQSGTICDEYAGIDGRVRVIHKENGGLSDARNTGLERAVGKYFMFVDSDDYIAPTMVEHLYNSIQSERADIAICNFCHVFDKKEKKDFSTDIKAEVLRGKEIFYYRKNDRSYGFWTVAWNKLYKRETFRNVRFRFGKYHEDEFWANDIYQMDIRVVTIPECLYYYRQRDNSIMRKESIARNLDILEALRERILIYLEKQEYTDQAYRVLIYSLEYLDKSKRLVTNKIEAIQFYQAEKRTKDIIQRMKKRKLSMIKKISLVFMRINPCLVFSVGMKFRRLLERFL